jgi:urea transport system ATP-binding protein
MTATTTTTTDTALTVQNLDVYYGESRILRDIKMDIPQGSIVAVMGRNGVGKTTLIKTIMGLLKPRTGVIHLGGENITDWTPDLRARTGLGYVPQGREIFPKLTVLENLQIGLEARTDGLTDIPEGLIYELFPVLAEMKHRAGGNLSGGQQQQLAIARALVGKPDILILDEPTEGIQPSIILDIEKVLLHLKDEGNLTIILVEQYFAFARQIADYFYLMERGTIALHGSAEELSDDSIKQYLTF